MLRKSKNNSGDRLGDVPTDVVVNALLTSLNLLEKRDRRLFPCRELFFVGAIRQQPNFLQTAVHLFEQFLVLGAAEIGLGTLHLVYARLF